MQPLSTTNPEGINDGVHPSQEERAYAMAADTVYAPSRKTTHVRPPARRSNRSNLVGRENAKTRLQVWKEPKRRRMEGESQPQCASCRGRSRKRREEVAKLLALSELGVESTHSLSELQEEAAPFHGIISRPARTSAGLIPAPRQDDNVIGERVSVAMPTALRGHASNRHARSGAADRLDVATHAHAKPWAWHTGAFGLLLDGRPGRTSIRHVRSPPRSL